jgi:tetratricopeptide (TPR) repeat protein
MTELFSKLKKLPPSSLLDAKFAETQIKKISDVFGDYEAALAIYNKEAGLKDEPYIPEKAVFYVKCQHCQNLSEFADLTEAQKFNKCFHCGKPLYKQCKNKKCAKMVLASLDKCPECDFVFASAAMFAKYFTAAEQAFRKRDLESARKFLLQAQSADPDEKDRTNELAARIEAEEKRVATPINDLRKLIADKMFERASGAVADITRKFPGLNVFAFEAQINTALSQARTAFANAKKLSPSRQADECLAILRDCVDFKPAISCLQAAPPETCKGFTIGIDSSAGCANISWSRSTEQGISYRLVRKQGKETPANEKDGEFLIDDTKETSYRDKTILPGQSCSYAVFAIRYSVFSVATGKTIVLLADVTEVHVEQMSTTVRLTWNTPKNCTGVTIRRTQNRTETVLTNSAHGSFEDKGVQYGTAYYYKLCANYANMPASQGVDIVITPMLKIDSFTISATQLKENIYKVTWSINRHGIDLRILLDEKQVRELKSDAGSCDLELPADSFHTITVLAYSGDNWLRSDNSPQVNTYSPCSIDKAASQFHEDAIAGLQDSAYSIELHLKIGGAIPSSVVGFYYAVRTGASQNRWPTTEDIGKATDIHRIGLAAYQKSGEILYTEVAREEGSYYVSLFTIYNMGGKEIVSNPKPCRFDRPFTADLFWKVSKNLLGELKLSIEISGNRPIVRVPELALCACADSQHLLSHSDPRAIRLLTIPAIELGTPQKVYKNSYDVKTDLSAKQRKGTKFFLFEVTPIGGENFTLHWIKGFKGKI